MAQSDIDAAFVDPVASEPPSGLFGGPPPNGVFLKPLERLGDYRILRELGRGGMGIVYEAEQVSLGRHVALKVLASASMLDPKHIERFHREAKAAARLHHTNIVPVFGVGEQDGLHYYVMQFIEGKGLDMLLGRLRAPAPTQTVPAPRSSDPVMPAVTVVCETPLERGDSHFEIMRPVGPASTRMIFASASGPLVVVPSGKALPEHMKPTYFRRAARIALQIAEALHYAHGQGVLHRDIKPSNLLVDSRDTVWVLDFGLAKLMEQNDLTLPGEVAGTLRYAPPERFQGKSDARSDIYSLGLTLYEILTLRPTFDGEDQASLLHKVMHEEAPPPRPLNPLIPRDLETVLLKAIARDPAHRYQTAGDLADDLRRFLDDKPVQARRVRPLERFWRWCRRNPVVAGLTATAATLLLLVAVVATVGYAYTQAALNREEQNRKEAVEQRHRAEANLTLSLQAFEEIFNSVTQQRAARLVDEGLEDSDEPPFHPVVSPEVAALLDNLLHFYDQFSKQNSDDPNLQRNAIHAHKRVGDLLQRLGQWDKAETAYLRALALYQQYGVAFPNEMVRRRETAAAWNELGAVYLMTGRSKEAEDAHRQALKILLEHPPQLTPSPQYRFEMVRTYNDLGYILGRKGQIRSAGEQLRDGLNLLDALLKEDPKNPSYRLTEARSYRQLAMIFGSQGNRKEEADAIAQAVKLLEELDREFPTTPDYRYELSETYALIDTRLRGPQARGDAVKRFQHAVDLATDLTQRYPNVPEYQASLARSQRKLGTAQRSAGKFDEAEKAFRLSVATQQSLADRFPKVPDYLMFLAESQLSLGELLNERHRYGDAKAVLEESITNQQMFMPTNDRNQHARRLLAAQYQAMANTLTQLGDKDEAQEMTKKAAEYRK